MKAVENAIVRKVMPYFYPYGYPLYPLYPLSSDLAGKVAAINAYQDIMYRLEYENAINNIVKPVSESVSKLLDAARSSSYVEKTNVQLEEQGVPVLVNPVIKKNKMGDVDLGFRNIIIDGVDGFNYV